MRFFGMCALECFFASGLWFTGGRPRNFDGEFGRICFNTESTEIHRVHRLKTEYILLYMFFACGLRVSLWTLC